MLLLYLLSQLFPHRVKAIYVNHQLQSANIEWAQFVTLFCQQNNIPCAVVPVTVSQGNLEQEARNSRYQAFERQLCPQDILVLAHHQQDQAETLLLRLFSGTGVQGMCAMRQIDNRDDMTLWRPLLDLSREQIEYWVDQLQLPFVTDLTNFDTHYDRAWARKSLWPLVSQRFPKMQEAICRTASLMQDTNEILQEILQQDFEKCVQNHCLNLLEFENLSNPRRRQLLSFWLKNIYRPSLDMVDRLQKEVIYSRVDAQAKLYVKPYWYVRYQNKIHRLTDQQYHVKSVPNKQKFEHSSFNFSFENSMGLSDQLLTEDLWLYSRQGGERIHLYGRVGEWPLKKAIQEAHIFPWLRHQIQILKKDNVILGVFTPKGFWLAQSEFCQKNGWLPSMRV